MASPGETTRRADAPPPALAAQTAADLNEGGSERLYARVARRIAAHLRSEGFRAGDKLPAETELADLVGASRATVREAVVALDVSGVVRLRRGAAAIVRNPRCDLIDSALRREAGPIEVLNVRLLIEPEAARLAALSPDPALCRALAEATAPMTLDETTSDVLEACDAKFHRILANGSGNSALAQMVADLWRLRTESRLWRRLEGYTQLHRNRIRAVSEHLTIIEAIQEGDAEKAAATMRSHVNGTRETAMSLGEGG